MSKKSDKKAKAKHSEKNQAPGPKNSLLNETMVGQFLPNRSGLVTNRQAAKVDAPKTVLSQVRAQPHQGQGKQSSVLSLLFSRTARKIAPPASSLQRLWRAPVEKRLVQGFIGVLIALGLGVGVLFAVGSEQGAAWFSSLQLWFASENSSASAESQGDLESQPDLSEAEATGSSASSLPPPPPPPAKAVKAAAQKKVQPPAKAMTKAKAKSKANAPGKAKVKKSHTKADAKPKSKGKLQKKKD